MAEREIVRSDDGAWRPVQRRLILQRRPPFEHDPATRDLDRSGFPRPELPTDDPAHPPRP